MKTYLIDLDNLNSDLCKDLIGFILTVGLNFRKLDRFKDSKTGKTLVVELETIAEDKALKTFLEKRGVSNSIIIKNDKAAVLNGKKIGIFNQVTNADNDFYVDNSTGRKFLIVR
jgi:hypothetical protein